MRAYPDTADLPKPLLEIGGLPVVEHVMRIYAAQGHPSFILAAGYRHDVVADRYDTPPPGLRVRVCDTGLDTDKGTRLRMVSPLCRGERFLASYADGLGNVDINALLRLHLEKKAAVTVTTVPLPSQYGTLVTDEDGRVTQFRETPLLRDHWINAGFFVIERSALETTRGDLETGVLPDLAERGLLFAYRHEGFWKSMDTFKDRQELDTLARSGPPPWLYISNDSTDKLSRGET